MAFNFLSPQLFLLITISLLHQTTTNATTIGVTYTTTTTSPPILFPIINTAPPPPPPPPPPSPPSPPPLPPDQIATTLTSLKFPSARLPDSDPNIVRAFSYTNTSLILSISNFLLPHIASNRSNAFRWIYLHVLPFYPRSRISLISVGDDVFDSQPESTPFLLPAIRNVYLALRDLGINKIAVSTTFSFFNIIITPFPPSSAHFREPINNLIMRPLLQFLDDTNSSFLVNIYPYNMYRANTEIPLGFALFQNYPFNFRDDLVTGVRYKNLFDMMVDAVVTALAIIGHENVPVVVAETGWPSSGKDSTEVDATPGYAELYLKGLVEHLKSGVGTPLKKEGAKEVYLYELVDTQEKGERHWGILYPNLTSKYNIHYSGGGGCGCRGGGCDNIWWLFVGFLVMMMIVWA